MKKSQGFAVIELEAHSIHGLDFGNFSSEHASGYGKPHAQILDFDNLFHFYGAASGTFSPTR